MLTALTTNSGGHSSNFSRMYWDCTPRSCVADLRCLGQLFSRSLQNVAHSNFGGTQTPTRSNRRDERRILGLNIGATGFSCLVYMYFGCFGFEAKKCFSRALLDPAGDVTDSEYDTDLMNISFQLKHCFRDYAMLNTIAHNLVTLRFDFEADKNYLSSVYHRLCSLLTDVLHCHVLITDWHNEFQFGKAFRQLLSEMKVPLWKCCEQVLVCCLDSYQSFASKKVLFPKTDSVMKCRDKSFFTLFFK